MFPGGWPGLPVGGRGLSVPGTVQEAAPGERNWCRRLLAHHRWLEAAPSAHETPASVGSSRSGQFRCQHPPNWCRRLLAHHRRLEAGAATTGRPERLRPTFASLFRSRLRQASKRSPPIHPLPPTPRRQLRRATPASFNATPPASAPNWCRRLLDIPPIRRRASSESTANGPGRRISPLRADYGTCSEDQSSLQSPVHQPHAESHDETPTWRSPRIGHRHQRIRSAPDRAATPCASHARGYDVKQSRCACRSQVHPAPSTRPPASHSILALPLVTRLDRTDSRLAHLHRVSKSAHSHRWPTCSLHARCRAEPYPQAGIHSTRSSNTARMISVFHADD
jgi:hypothetical protein